MAINLRSELSFANTLPPYYNATGGTTTLTATVR